MKDSGSAQRPDLPRPYVWAILAGVLALSLFLSLYRLPAIPPGLHHDEAYYGLDALRVLSDGIHPIYFEKNNGREPLFIYLLALVFRLVPPTTLVMRQAAAALGLLTLPLLYLLVRESLRDVEPRHATAAGLFSVIVLATLYWHVHYSRLALRAVMIPPAETLVVWLFWRAVRRRRWPDFLWAGLALGISMYTYLSARLLAPMLGLFLVLTILEQRDFLKRHWREMALFFGAALAISLPLWIYFAQHPDVFIYRLQQVNISNTQAQAEGSQDLWGNLGRTLLMFTTHGDWGWPNNLPGRPVFDAAQMIGFFLGLAAVGRRFRQARWLQWPLWVLTMTLPMALTVYPPNYIRSLGATVPLAALAGIGFAQLWDWATRRLRRPRFSMALLLALLVGLGAFSGWTTYRDYFLNWARQPELNVYFNTDLRQAEQAILSLPDQTTVYLSFEEPFPYQAALDFAIQKERFAQPPAARRTYTLRWHNRNCLTLPTAQTGPIAYLLPPAGETFLPTLQALYPAGKLKGPYANGDGQPYFLRFRVSAPAAPQPVAMQPQWPADAILGDAFTLLGGDLSVASGAALQPGDGFAVTLYWRITRPLPADEKIFVQLLGETLNAAGNPVWAQVDEMPCQETYPTAIWEAGTTVLTRHPLTLAGDAPAGDYRLIVGMYDPRDGARLPVRDAAGQAASDASVKVGDITVR